MADLRGERGTLGGANSFNFMLFLGTFGKFVCWCAPGELAPPPLGNPGSATGSGQIYGGVRDARPLSVQFFSIPCSFEKNNRFVPPSSGLTLVPPSQGNSETVTELALTVVKLYQPFTMIYHFSPVREFCRQQERI